MFSQENQNDKRWIWLFLTFLLRDPVILIAVCATFLEEVGYDLSWHTLLFVCLTNFFVIRLVMRLVLDTICLCLDLFSSLWKWQEGRMQMRKKGIAEESARLINMYEVRCSEQL